MKIEREVAGFFVPYRYFFGRLQKVLIGTELIKAAGWLHAETQRHGCDSFISVV